MQRGGDDGGRRIKPRNDQESPARVPGGQDETGVAQAEMDQPACRVRGRVQFLLDGHRLC